MLYDILKTIGYAAPKMARSIAKMGGQVIAGPEGFYVMGKEGPLKTREIERAQSWGKLLTQS
ncbi:hypothetical protein A2154_01675 [Candidatus Gottesmanbacteria bacterium RBG_16_43_7]|uniref:Flavodoxin-like domain-containing protein n=1 Tax=Candidatus Gottesmanbacteria bacterium RBG_16_43_7 TaxID=1798373 RepID=A0A1F5ZBA0_9BACT|nr:MAG: hypothetical protein A2154_01675 [Candidatus Gottesmanbacteria bacterium RBG_16_43_7]